jgi:catecholate siderophore receptor
VNNPNPWDPWVGSISPNQNYVTINTRSASLYAFDTITLSEQWLVNAGLRYDDYTSETVTSTATPTPAFSKLKSQDGLFNYQLGIVFKPMSNGSVYLSHGTSSTPVNSSMGEGAESQSQTLTTKDLKPEENTSYELGTKWDLLDQHVGLTAAVFRMETENARVTDATGAAVNSGSKKVEGLELGLTGNITEAWQLFAGYTQLRSKLLHSGAVNTNTTAAPNWVVGLYDGNEFPNTPEKSASLWTSYKIIPSITIGGGANYMSKVWGNVANTKWVPSYTRYDAMAQFELNKNLNLQLNIQNLTDKVYFDKAYASHYASIAPGRSGTLTLNFKY